MSFQFRRKRDEAKAILEYSSSPWFTRLSFSPDSLMDSFRKVHGFDIPYSRRWLLSSNYLSPRTDPSVEGSSPMAFKSAAILAEENLDVCYRGSSLSSGVAVVGNLCESRRSTGFLEAVVAESMIISEIFSAIGIRAPSTRTAQNDHHYPVKGREDRKGSEESGLDGCGGRRSPRLAGLEQTNGHRIRVPSRPK